MKRAMLFAFLLACLTLPFAEVITRLEDGGMDHGSWKMENGSTHELPMVVMETPIRVGPASGFEQVGVLRAGTFITQQFGCVEFRGSLTDGAPIMLETWLQIGEARYVLVTDWTRVDRVTGVCE